MSIRREDYRKRLIDDKISKYLKIFGAVEIKLSDINIEEAKKNLLKFYQNTHKKPKFMCIIVGHYEAAVKDKDTGIYIIPITSLKP